MPTHAQPDHPPLGSALRELRNRLDMTVPQMASLIGVSISSYYRWENAKSARLPDPRAVELLLMCDTLDKELPATRDFFLRGLERAFAAPNHQAIRALHAMLGAFLMSPSARL